jgi:phage tail sheath protein FI
LEVDVLATPGFSSGAVIGTAIQIVSGRGDSVYLVDPPFGLRPQQTVDWHNGMLLSDLQQAINTSYAGLYTGWLLVFDQFSGQNVWIPPSGHISAVFSRSAREGDPWSAPAGLRRGRLLSPIAVEYSPTQGERDLLYGSGNSVNPIVNFTQEGLTVWGNRTLQRGESPLSRMDVRLLVNRVRRGLAQLLRNFVFEPNDRVLWSQVRASINPFLSDIQSRRGLVEFVAIVDENNNTPERIDRGELWVSVILVPQRSAEIVVLNIGVTRQSVSLTSEEVLSAVGVTNGG